MNVLRVWMSDYQKVMKNKQKYCISNYALVDKKFLKKCDKETKKTIKKTIKSINKEIQKKCKTCINYDKKNPNLLGNYSNDVSKICLDCGLSPEWKNYKSKE